MVTPNNTLLAPDIIAELPEADRAAVAKHMARIELALARRRLICILEPYIRQWIKEEINAPTRSDHGRHQQDADLVDSLLRIFKSPLGKTLRNKIKEIANG